MVDERDVEIEELKAENLRLRAALASLAGLALETALQTRQLTLAIAQSNERIKQILDQSATDN